MIAAGIISVPFCLVSLYFLLTYLHYKMYGKRIKAKVFAYEKYISKTSTSSHGTSSQLLYSPIFKYTYAGNEYYIQGAGRNYFPYKIGEVENILMLNNEPKNVLIDSITYPLFGSLFGFFGFGAQIYYHLFNKRTLIEHFYPLLLMILVPFLFVTFLKKKGLWKEVVKGHFENSSFVTPEKLQEKEIFYNDRDISEEESKTYKLGLIVGLVFLSGCIFGVNYAWEKMPQNIKEVLKNFSWNELQPHIEHPMVILFGFCSLMSLLLIYSSIKSLTKI